MAASPPRPAGSVAAKPYARAPAPPDRRASRCQEADSGLVVRRTSPFRRVGQASVIAEHHTGEHPEEIRTTPPEEIMTKFARVAAAAFSTAALALTFAPAAGAATASAAPPA